MMRKLTYYFDTSFYNSALDYPKIENYIQELCDIKNVQLLVSLINIEEFKLAPKERRIQLFGILKKFKNNLALLRRPELLEELEYIQAFGGGFEWDTILENDESKLNEFYALIDRPDFEVPEKEKKEIVLTKLRNKYAQTTLRKEPKIIFDASIIKNSALELLALSEEELKKKIKNFNQLNHLNKPFEEKDIFNAIRNTLILKLSSKRPQILYFFSGSEKPHPMFKFWWPGKKDDKRIAGQIMSLDFKKYCPGTWFKYSVYYKQAHISIEPSNWGDLSHAFYIPYVKIFLTSDRDFCNILRSIKNSEFDYCAKIGCFNDRSKN